MRPIMTTIAVAMLCAPSAVVAQEVRYAPDHSGRMSVDYRPVMCVVAPCPPGNYVIEGEGFSEQARNLIVENDGVISHHTGSYLDFTTFIGGIWMGSGAGVDINGTPLDQDTIAIRVAPHNPGGR